jgi:hypothetical protein
MDEIARSTGAELVDVQEVEYAGRTVRRAFFERDGRRFALVPGGQARVGFDPARFEPTQEQHESYGRSAAEYGLPRDVREHLARVTSPRRTVRVPTMLVGVEPVKLTDSAPQEVAGVLAEIGTRLPTPDEWEYACGAGAGSLFRWGDDAPVDRFPSEAKELVGDSPFGLSIARNPYNPELTSDPDVLCGGDGGEAICGGYGYFLAWLPLAGAYRDQGLPEMMNDDDWDMYFDVLRARPVIEVE